VCVCLCEKEGLRTQGILPYSQSCWCGCVSVRMSMFLCVSACACACARVRVCVCVCVCVFQQEVLEKAKLITELRTDDGFLVTGKTLCSAVC